MKRILLMICLLILLSGCKAVTRVDNYDYKMMLDKVLKLNINYHNKIGNGYVYYAPKGVVRTFSGEFNDVLKRENNIYYLYVDVVSYYYKSNLDFKENKEAFFSKIINNGNKKGYIEIKEKNGEELYIQMHYNYAKIETYVNKKNLKTAITDLSYILSSIDFNDSLLKKMYESGDMDAKEEVYKLFDNKEKDGNFIEYIKEYDKYEGYDPEDDIINNEVIIESQQEEKTTTTTKQKEKTTSANQ